MSAGKITKMVVLGGGAWGTALASLYANHGLDISLWARSAKTISEVNDTHRNTKYLGDIALSPNLTATDDLTVLKDADCTLMVLPAQQFAHEAQKIKAKLNKGAPLVLCSKGVDQTNGLLMSQIAQDAFSNNPVAALSGPSFAKDVAGGLPTAVTLAMNRLGDAEQLCQSLSTPSFRLYASDDLIGVELGGALKNVLAIAVGAVRGMRLGASAEAALIARGFAELRRFAREFGAKPDTLMGLSGLGDLVLTCSSPQSRNFAYGVAVGAGKPQHGLPLAEGVYTAKIVARLSAEKNIDAPITTSVAQILDGQMTAEQAMQSLLQRPLKSEDLA